MDHMKSRNSMVGGEDPIRSKKLEVTKVASMPTPKTNTNLGPESKEYQKYVADTDKKGRKNAAIRNLKKFGKITLGGAATLAAGYYGLTKEVGGKDIKDYSGRVTGKTEKKRIWRWKDE